MSNATQNKIHLEVEIFMAGPHGDVLAVVEAVFSRDGFEISSVSTCDGDLLFMDEQEERQAMTLLNEKIIEKFFS